jgi:hypothetical protein
VECAETQGRNRDGWIDGIGETEEECMKNLYAAEQAATIEAVAKIGDARLKYANNAASVEETCIREMYKAEQEAKTSARREEHKANLKELKQTREYERK